MDEHRSTDLSQIWNEDGLQQQNPDKDGDESAEIVYEDMDIPGQIQEMNTEVVETNSPVSLEKDMSTLL